MDRKTAIFARSWAKRYVREKHPCGLDVEDVENRILESLYKYSRGNPPSGCDLKTDPVAAKAISEALNAVQNEGRRNLRALNPWQVRGAESHLEDMACRNLACDMHRLRIRQSVREDDSRRVRMVIGMLSPDDRRVALDFMDLLSWQKVAVRRGMSEGTFRRHVLDGFVSRFKDT